MIDQKYLYGTIAVLILIIVILVAFKGGGSSGGGESLKGAPTIDDYVASINNDPANM